MTDAEPLRGARLREGLPEDLDAVVALDRATASAPHWTRMAYAEIVAPEAATTRRRLVLAEDDEAGGCAIVGFAVGSVQGGTSELESVAVAAGRRRGGVGLALCEAVMEWAQGREATEIVLEVRGSNASAIALYARLGFQEIARRPGYYREPVEDAVVMRRGISG